LRIGSRSPAGALANSASAWALGLWGSVEHDAGLGSPVCDDWSIDGCEIPGPRD
jgi:hypothetical protein